MAGCWNVSLLMIKVSTVLDTNKQDFWIISSETRHPLGSWGCAIYGYSILINVLSVYPKHLTGFCFEDGCSFYNPRSIKGKVFKPYRFEACIITKDLILGTALGPSFSYSPSFRIWYVQYSIKDRIWQPLKSFHYRVQASVEGTGWGVPMTKQWPPELMMERRAILTGNSHTGNWLPIWMPQRTPGRHCWLPAPQPLLLPSSLMINFQFLPPPAQKELLTCGRQLRWSHFPCWDTDRYGMPFWMMPHERGSIGRGVLEGVLHSLKHTWDRHILISSCLYSLLSASDFWDLATILWLWGEPASENKPMCWGKQSRKSELI